MTITSEDLALASATAKDAIRDHPNLASRITVTAMGLLIKIDVGSSLEGPKRVITKSELDKNGVDHAVKACIKLLLGSIENPA